MSFRKLLDKENVRRLHDMSKRWYEWVFQVEQDNVSEMTFFAASVERHEEKIRNYIVAPY
jgi:transposase